jgi:hypothetical protein
MNDIESVKPAISVTIDDGDFIINSTGPLGKAMSQAILPLAAGAHKVVIITDGEMKVMKRNPATENGATNGKVSIPPPRRTPVDLAATLAAPDDDDVQDSFISDLESGKTGEKATGEQPSPTPGPSDPVAIPAKKRVPRIYQDAAAPPAPELAEAEMDRLLAEAQQAEQAEQDAAKLAEDQRFQRQQAVQVGEEPVEDEVPDKPRKRGPRNLAVTGQACGNCGGTGHSVRVDSTGSTIPDEQGRPLSGVCQVCSGQGRVMAWGRGRSSRVR